MVIFRYTKPTDFSTLIFSFSSYCLWFFFREVKVQIAKENDSILMAKEFLRKQRQSLKRRQAALLAAKQELMKDVIKQKQGVSHPRDSDTRLTAGQGLYVGH